MAEKRRRLDEKGRVPLVGHVDHSWRCCDHPPCYYDMDSWDGRICSVCGADCILCQIRPGVEI